MSKIYVCKGNTDIFRAYDLRTLWVKKSLITVLGSVSTLFEMIRSVFQKSVAME